jgi:hypothetical protein
MNTKLYLYTTDGSAKYLCTDHIDGCNEGDLATAVIRLDGGAEFVNSVYSTAPELLKALEGMYTWMQNLREQNNLSVNALIDAQPEHFGLKYAVEAIAKATEGAV